MSEQHGPTPSLPGEPSYQEAEAILRQLAGAFSPPAAEVGGPARNDPTWAAHQLHKAEIRFRTLVEQIPAVTFMAALDEGVSELYVSPQIEALLGFSQKEWLEDPILWYTRLHPDDRERWHQEFARTCVA